MISLFRHWSGPMGWLGLLGLGLLLSACTENEDSRSDARLQDAAMPNAAMPNTAMSNNIDEAESLPSIEDACAIRSHAYGASRYHSSLESLCAALERDGRLRCPTDRTALLQDVADRCGRIERRCRTDRISDTAGEITMLWSFAADTGQLVGARVTLEGFACTPERHVYVGGRDPDACAERLHPASMPEHALCDVCWADYDDNCPREITEVLPAEACQAPSAAPGCACDGESSGLFEGLPVPGAACGAPTECPRCQSGTCWADCLCARDGTFRWRTECTE